MSALTFRPQQVTSFTRSLAFPRTRPQSSPHCAAMPSSLRSALPRNLSRPLDNTSVYYCTSCSTWRRALSTRAGARSTGINKINSSRRSGRLLESPASVTIRPFATSVITAGKTVPPRFKELYDALNGVENAAIQEVSISRLQLALRSLESEAPLIRVAGEFCPAQWPSVGCCGTSFLTGSDVFVDSSSRTGQCQLCAQISSIASRRSSQPARELGGRSRGTGCGPLAGTSNSVQGHF